MTDQERSENKTVAYSVIILVVALAATPWLIGFAVKYLNFVYNFFEMGKLH